MENEFIQFIGFFTRLKLEDRKRVMDCIQKLDIFMTEKENKAEYKLRVK